jgi:hypothetical protein
MLSKYKHNAAGPLLKPWAVSWYLGLIFLCFAWMYYPHHEPTGPSLLRMLYTMGAVVGFNEPWMVHLALGASFLLRAGVSWWMSRKK